MSGFNEVSAQPEQAQGIGEIANTPDQPLAAGTPSEPSVRSGEVGLAWWDAMKYYWRQNASGRGSHLAPQDSFVDDVLDRGNHYVVTTAKTLGKDEYAEFEQLAELRKSLIQQEDAFDTAGTEGNAVRREVLNRLIIARKIAGTSAISAEHRVTRELSLEHGNVEKMKSDPNGHYQTDVQHRNNWANKAVRLEYVAKAIADGDVIPTDDAAFSQLIAKRISRSLYDDAVEKGNKLKKPSIPQASNGSKPSREELLALTA